MKDIFVALLIFVLTVAFITGWFVAYFRIKKELQKQGIEMTFYIIEYKEKRKKER